MSLNESEQIVYLDFDGASQVSYRGELLELDGIDVSASGVSAVEAAAVTGELNRRYAGRGVRFVTELPEAGEYSTVYIGQTDAFDAFGTFAGISETVDAGNLRSDDNAFVMLDASAGIDRIVSVAAHEVEHLLGAAHADADGTIADYARSYYEDEKYDEYYHLTVDSAFGGESFSGEALYVIVEVDAFFVSGEGSGVRADLYTVSVAPGESVCFSVANESEDGRQLLVKAQTTRKNNPRSALDSRENALTALRENTGGGFYVLANDTADYLTYYVTVGVKAKVYDFGLSDIGDIEDAIDDAEKTAYSLDISRLEDSAPPVMSNFPPELTVTVNSLRLRWTEAYDDLFVSGYEVVLHDAGGNQLGGVRTVSEPRIIVNDLADGDYSCSIRACDLGGNRSEAVEYEFTVDAPDNASYHGFEGRADSTATMELERFKLAAAGFYSWGDFSSTVRIGMTVTLISDATGKAVKSATVSKGDFTAGSVKPFLLDAGSYTVRVKSSARCDYFSFGLSGDIFPVATDDNDAGSAELCRLDDSGSFAAAGWVGYGDAADWRRIEPEYAGFYDIGLSGVESSTRLSLLAETVNRNGAVSYKKIKSVTITPKTDRKSGLLIDSGGFSRVLLDAGTKYFISVESPGAKKAQNSAYNLNVSGELFTRANIHADDDWRSSGLLTLGFGGIDSDWVGYGDAVDWRRLTVDESGAYDFTLSGLDTRVKLVVCEAAGAKCKTLGSVTVAPRVDKKTGALVNYGGLSGVLLRAGGNYLVSVASPGAKKAQNSDYLLAFGGEKFDNPGNGVADNRWGDAEVRTLDFASGIVNDWVGFGDAVDFFRFELDADGAGRYGFDLDADVDKFAAMKLYRVATANGREKLVSVRLDKDGFAELGVGEYALEIKSADNGKGKKNTGYSVAVELPRALNADTRGAAGLLAQP